MKNGFDIATDVRSLLNVPAITNEITGNIYPVIRPSKSDKIDIVIGVLNVNNEQVQESDVNVRVHGPSIQQSINGIITNLPDQATFDRITKIIVSLIDGQYRNSFFTAIDFAGQLFRDKDGSYFSLTRVTYRSIQDNYKNI